MRIIFLVLLVMSLLFQSVAAAAFAANEDTAGIPPLSPHEVMGKANKAIEATYKSAQPLVDGLSKVVLGLAGILALLVLISGLSLLKRVVGAAISVALGLLLFYNAGLIVSVIKGASAWFARQ